ncbi:cysteine--tRNA ligase [bacterium]|nr:cysteine--tRNA ligase [bacterium]|tara:strand:- start:3570 stop:4760 length:1191 start_codon:yes stop_codon:yes gene_type:complete
MPLKIYNSLTRKKEVFKPLKKGFVKMYVCGPTVYGPSHIGHARTYTGFDIIRRWLETKYKVKFVMNITDVHDDIKPTTDTKKFTKLFLSDMKALGIKPAYIYPKVSQHISEIKKLVKILIKKGFAYKSKNAVYFNVSKFKNYGKLSKRKLEKAKTGTRIDSDKFERNQAVDFALWKSTRPGWHIECSAMIMKHLGEQIDIHAGGNDLMFPHHENEIAQSEAATGKTPFVKYWMHSGMLYINGTKMSKSLKNYIEIPDLLKKYNPRVIRFFIASKHYRSQANFTDNAMDQARAGLAKLDNFSLGKVDIQAELDDDFNTPKALAKIFKAKKWPDEMETIFGIKRKKIKIPELIHELIHEREIARKNKNFAKSDKIRIKIEKLGYLTKDTKTGPVLTKK